MTFTDNDPMFNLLRSKRRKEKPHSGRPRMELPAGDKFRMPRKAWRFQPSIRSKFLSATADRVRTIFKTAYVRRAQQNGREISEGLKYMQDRQRDPFREPEERKFQDRERNSIDKDEAFQRMMEHRGDKVAVHQLIFSPGDNSIDMSRYTREMMERLEERLEMKLDYVFVVHKNTENFHSHVMLAGKSLGSLHPGDGLNSKDLPDIYLDKSDLQFLRDAGDEFLYREKNIDRAYDRAVQEEFGRTTVQYEVQELQEINRYDRELAKEFGLANTDADREALRELNIELNPYDAIINRAQEARKDVDLVDPSKFEEHVRDAEQLNPQEENIAKSVLSPEGNESEPGLADQGHDNIAMLSESPWRDNEHEPDRVERSDDATNTKERERADDEEDFRSGRHRARDEE